MDRQAIISFFDNLIKPGDKRNRIVAIWTAVFLTAAHAFRWFNMGFNHDSLKVLQYDANWQAYLGRYLAPVYLLFRGRIGAPFLIALIAGSFLIVANILMVRILRIKKPLHVIMFCALSATSPVLISLFASVLTATDLHILALMFATLSVYVLLECDRKWGWVLAALFLACSLALYQAYAQVVVTLILLRLLLDLLTEPDFGVVWRKKGRVILFFLFGAAVYFVGYVLFIKIVYGLDLSQLPSNGQYNSLDGMTHLRLADIPKLLAGMYKSFARYFVRPETRLLRVRSFANLTVFACVLYYLFRSDAPVKRKLMAAGLLLLFPLGTNFVYVLSRGKVHSLMRFSYTVLSGGILALAEIRRSSSIVRGVTVAALSFIVWGNVLFANTFYLRKNLEAQATLSVMTRLLGTIESVEGYKPGETSVVLVGDLNKSDIKQVRYGYPSLHILEDKYSFSVTYPESYADYFTTVLGYPLNFMYPDVSSRYAKMEEVLSMPSFPSPCCAKMIGDTLVVRLSEDLSPWKM